MPTEQELIDKTDRYLSSLAAKMSKTAKMLSGVSWRVPTYAGAMLTYADVC